jgi:D-alanyl-D-alanine carboxypeptidase/D-alanyl-D-alanine-endopeptidase (penicillin-binding protein 4)
MKLLTTAAALVRLGPDYRFVTELWSSAPSPDGDGSLHGDLILPGHGDPTLSRRFWPDDEAPLLALADSLLAAGVRDVRGALVIDASAWDSTTVEGTWMVGDLSFGYAATGGAFVIAEGVTTVEVEGAEPGRPARVRWGPVGDSSFVRSEVTTAAAADSTARVRASYLPESRRLHLSGTVRAGTVDTLRLATRDPVAEASRALLGALERHGVTVRDGLRIVWDSGEALEGGCRAGDLPACTGAWRVAGLASPPLIVIAEGILEPSQNWMAEQLLRHLGEVQEGRASWETARTAVRALLADSLGVDTLDVRVVDGSGLSAYNLVTPRALARVLAGVSSRPWGAAYREALPTPGEEDGTLERRLPGLEGRLHAKTGTIRHVNSLSGYLTTDSGRELVIVLLSNGSGLPSGLVRDALDDVVRSLAADDAATHGGGADPVTPPS